jgi:hypothetical protein
MNRYARTLLLLIALQLVWGCHQGESASKLFARKAPGERVTLAWDYPVGEEPKIKEFVLKRSSSVKGPYRLVVTVKRDQRKIEFKVTFDPGTSSSFYVVVAIVGAVETAPTNSIEIRKK